MRDRIIMAAFFLAALAIVGGIVLYNNSGDDPADSPVKQGPGERIQAGEGIHIDGPFFNPFIEREQLGASQPVSSTNARSTNAAPEIRTSMSPASGVGPAPAARPGLVSAPAPPACAPSLLGPVIGLLSALLGRGVGGC